MGKICSKCKEEKDIDMFYTNRSSSRAMCKKCQNIRAKNNRDNNKEKIKERAKIYRLTDRFKKAKAARQHRYWINNIEKCKARGKKWRESNREKRLDYKAKDRAVLNASYVKYFIVRGTSLKYKDVTDSLVNCYRRNIEIKRFLKERTKPNDR